MFIRHEFIERNAFLLLVLTLITIAIGGLLFLLGALIMAFNLWRTVYPREEIAPVATMAPAE